MNSDHFDVLLQPKLLIEFFKPLTSDLQEQQSAEKASGSTKMAQFAMNSNRNSIPENPQVISFTELHRVMPVNV